MSALWKGGTSVDPSDFPKTMELSPRAILAAKSSYANLADTTNLLEGLTKMVSLIEEIEAGLAEHEQAIATIEGFMEKHATEAGNAIDPLRLQGVLAKVKEQTMRLGAVMAKFPIVKLDVPPPIV